MELDLMGEAESDSDSDSAHSQADNASTQRSAVTAATAGSDAGLASLAYFSEEEEEESAGESSNQEEEESEGEGSEHDAEHMDEQLERRSTSGRRGFPQSTLSETHYWVSHFPLSCLDCISVILQAPNSVVSKHHKPCSGQCALVSLWLSLVPPPVVPPPLPIHLVSTITIYIANFTAMS